MGKVWSRKLLANSQKTNGFTHREAKLKKGTLQKCLGMSRRYPAHLG
jgi:hypothetical protein